jgi:hypothetical protein
MPPDVAALFVQRGGIYWDKPDIDAWDEQRDARLYDGTLPVVAHPPCQLWVNFAALNFSRYGGGTTGLATTADASSRHWIQSTGAAESSSTPRAPMHGWRSGCRAHWRTGGRRQTSPANGSVKSGRAPMGTRHENAHGSSMSASAHRSSSTGPETLARIRSDGSTASSQPSASPKRVAPRPHSLTFSSH